jgi:hypothetical protein
VNQSDPTDSALAAIASILDQPESHREPEAVVSVEENPLMPAQTDVAGYSKIGPGPLAAIRFKWTVRRDDNGRYYVDETVGENSAPITSGPMSADAAVRLVDEREGQAQQRFDQLRSEMSGRAEVANLIRNDGGEM